MFTQHANTSLFFAHVSHMDAWRTGPARKVIDNLLAQGILVMISGPSETKKILLRGDTEQEIELTEPDKDGAQWWIMPAP